MAKSKKGNSKLMKRARRDVKLTNRPALRSIKRETQQGRDEFANMGAGIDSAYGGYQEQIAPLATQYQNQTAGISGDLTNQIAGLMSLIPGNMPQGEVGASGQVAGQYGVGALEGLASQAQRNLGYQQSAVREGGLAQRTAQGNRLQDLQDFLQYQRGRRMDIRGNMAMQIRAREDELRQQALENRLARSDIQSNKATAQALIDMIGGTLRGDN